MVNVGVCVVLYRYACPSPFTPTRNNLQTSNLGTPFRCVTIGQSGFITSSWVLQKIDLKSRTPLQQPSLLLLIYFCDWRLWTCTVSTAGSESWPADANLHSGGPLFCLQKLRNLDAPPFGYCKTRGLNSSPDPQVFGPSPVWHLDSNICPHLCFDYSSGRSVSNRRCLHTKMCNLELHLRRK
jgi:hypothetical protein